MYRAYKTALLITFMGHFWTSGAPAQGFNQWQGSEADADWNNPYKWKLQHVPTGDETVHFRQDQSIITVNSTVELDNGMMLYGRDLFLQGNGNINLWNPIPHRRTVNIPASATGYANLTLTDSFSLHGRISLAAKAFGTSASKGSVTLKDRSNIMGVLSIGNSGSGTGQVFIQDEATFHISGLEINTLAEKGGMAEIHILGGTASLEANAHSFETFMADPSRKIIIGEKGKLVIDSPLPAEQKRKAIAEMIEERRIVAASDCSLRMPEIHDHMVIISAVFGDEPQPEYRVEDNHRSSLAQGRDSADDISSDGDNQQPTGLAEHDPSMQGKLSKLETLLHDMQTNQQQDAVVVPAPEEIISTASQENPVKKKSVPLTGYIAFASAILFLIRPKKED